MPTTPQPAAPLAVRHRWLIVPFAPMSTVSAQGGFDAPPHVVGHANGQNAVAERAISDWIDALGEEYVVKVPPRLVEFRTGVLYLFVEADHLRAYERLDVVEGSRAGLRQAVGQAAIAQMGGKVHTVETGVGRAK